MSLRAQLLAAPLLLWAAAGAWAAGPTGPRLTLGDLHLPLLPGASTTLQYSASKDTILNGATAADARALRGIESVSLAVLKVSRPKAKPWELLEWYDARIRAVGWPPKLRRPQVSAKGASAIYHRSGKGLLVIDVARQKDTTWEIQLVYVLGDIQPSAFASAFGPASKRSQPRRG